MCGPCVRVRVCVCMCMCVRVWVCTCVCMRLCVCVCVRAYERACECMSVRAIVRACPKHQGSSHTFGSCLSIRLPHRLSRSVSFSVHTFQVLLSLIECNQFDLFGFASHMIPIILCLPLLYIHRCEANDAIHYTVVLSLFLPSRIKNIRVGYHVISPLTKR